MKAFIHSTFLLFLFPLLGLAQDDFNFPTDIVYHEAENQYYVSNWADGDGYILTVNSSWEVTGTLFSDLDFAGGLCLVDDVLYVADNGDLWGGSLPSYLVGIDVTTGAEVLRKEIATGGTYLDLMTTDNNGNIYICDSEQYFIHKYNILLQQSEVFVEGASKPLGICYDHLNDRILFTESKSTLSRLRAIAPEGGDITNVYSRAGWIEGVEMADDGSFYMTSWSGATTGYGDEPVVKVGHSFGWEHVMADDLNRPFGLCLGHDNQLVVCNWGVHELYVLDLTLFGAEEVEYQLNVPAYPNPASGWVTLGLPEAIHGPVDLKLFDGYGKLVRELNVAIAPGQQELHVDLEGLRPGFYAIMGRANQFSFRSKLVIQ